MMRLITRFSLFSVFAAIILAACSESFTDPRDGKSYAIVQIGSQTWMAENMDYEVQGSACPEGDDRKCSKYGRLYTWAVAQKVCPEGWHLPDSADFEKLIASVGGAEVAGYALKATSGWFKKGNGSDEFGFNAMPAGYRLAGRSDGDENAAGNGAGGKFDGIGGYAHFWSATETAEGLAYYMLLDFSTKAAKLSAFGKDESRSVRCVR